MDNARALMVSVAAAVLSLMLASASSVAPNKQNGPSSPSTASVASSSDRTGRSALVAEDIAAGRLVAPFPQIRPKAERGYDLVYRVGNREHP